MDRRRRSTLIALALAAFSLLSMGWLTLRAWLPWISRGGDGRWRLGPRSRFPEGTATLLRRADAIVVHDHEGYRALSSLCTHERCTVRPLSARKELVCPCHGAAYDWLGRVKRGPAPLPLPWLALIEEEGELVLDPSRTVEP